MRAGTGQKTGRDDFHPVFIWKLHKAGYLTRDDFFARKIKRWRLQM